MAHTLGPWEWTGIEFAQADPGEMSICRVSLRGDSLDLPNPYDALLIIAAPTMLAALQRVWDEHDSGCITDDCVKQVIAAIRDAKGTS